jgi:hypothetical protein
LDGRKFKVCFRLLVGYLGMANESSYVGVARYPLEFRNPRVGMVGNRRMERNPGMVGYVGMVWHLGMVGYVGMVGNLGVAGNTGKERCMEMVGYEGRW